MPGKGRGRCEGREGKGRESRDDVEWSPAQEAEAEAAVAAHLAAPMDPQDARSPSALPSSSFPSPTFTAPFPEKLESAPETYWDAFYGHHQNRFFKVGLELHCTFVIA